MERKVQGRSLKSEGVTEVGKVSILVVNVGEKLRQ